MGPVHLLRKDVPLPASALENGTRAVFLDRDGVLNEVVWRAGKPASPRSPQELVLVEGAADEVARLRSAGLKVFVVSNQPDVARGLLPAEHLAAMTRTLQQRLDVDDVAVCTHDDADGCACRKPRPGMLATLATRWGVELERSFVIGDSWKDVEAGRAAGCTTILLRRPYNHGATGDHMAESLSEAVGFVLEAVTAFPGEDGAGHAQRYLAETRSILELLDAAALEGMATGLAALRETGGRLFFLGVGGGAGHASHAACDFRKIARIESYAVCDNVPELTARTNDEGWASTYAEYLKGSRLRPEDGVFVFSVGGGSIEMGVSENLVRAVAYAREVGATIFGVVGRDGGFTARVAHHCVVIPTVNAQSVTPQTESVQALVWHLLVSHPLLRQAPMKWESLARVAP